MQLSELAHTHIYHGHLHLCHMASVAGISNAHNWWLLYRSAQAQEWISQFSREKSKVVCLQRFHSPPKSSGRSFAAGPGITIDQLHSVCHEALAKCDKVSVAVEGGPSGKDEHFLHLGCWWTKWQSVKKIMGICCQWIHGKN